MWLPGAEQDSHTGFFKGLKGFLKDPTVPPLNFIEDPQRGVRTYPGLDQRQTRTQLLSIPCENAWIWLLTSPCPAKGQEAALPSEGLKRSPRPRGRGSECLISESCLSCPVFFPQGPSFPGLSLSPEAQGSRLGRKGSRGSS